MSWLPGFWKLLYWRSGRLLARGEIHKAREVTSSYTRRRRKDPMGWVLMAQLSYNLQEYTEAEGAARDGLLHHPESAELKGRLGEALYKQSRYEDASAVWTEMVRIHPSYPDAYTGLAYIALRAGDDARARELIHEALKRAPSPSQVFDLAALALHASGDRAWAESLVRTASKASGMRRDPALHLFMAIILEEKDPGEARKRLRLARRYAHRRPPHVMREVESLKSLVATTGETGKKGTSP
jgi:Flp pilus assembly protein TadD